MTTLAETNPRFLLASQRTGIIEGAMQALRGSKTADGAKAFVSTIVDPRFTDIRDRMLPTLTDHSLNNTRRIEILEKERQDAVAEEALAIFDDVMQPRKGDEGFHPMRPPQNVANIITSFLDLSNEDLRKLTPEEARTYLDARATQLTSIRWRSDLRKCLTNYRLGVHPSFSLADFASRCTSLHGIKLTSENFTEQEFCELVTAFKHIFELELKYSDCEGKRFKDSHLAFIATTCPHLTTLALSGGEFNDLSPLRSMTSLSSLSLSCLYAVPQDFSVLCDLKNLRKLEFSVNFCKFLPYNTQPPALTQPQADALYRIKDLPQLVELDTRSCSRDCRTRSPYETALNEIMPAIEMRKRCFDLLEDLPLSNQEKADLVNPFVQLVDVPHPMPAAPVTTSVSDEVLEILSDVLDGQKPVLDLVLSYFSEEELTGTTPEFTKARLIAILSQLELSSVISSANIRNLVFGFTELHRINPELFNAGFTPLRFVLNRVTQNGERIKTLNLSNSNITEKNLSKYLMLFPKVEVLHLDHCPNLTNGAMQQLVAVKDTLKILHLAETPVTVFSFVRHLPHLEEINIGGVLETDERDRSPLFDHPGIVLLTMEQTYYIEKALENRLKHLPQKIRDGIREQFLSHESWHRPMLAFADGLTKALKQARRPIRKPARIKGLEG